MSAILITQPQRSDINGSKTSRWCAVHHPLLFIFQRKDFSVSSIANSGGFIKMICPVGTDLNPDDQIYLKCGPYDAAYTITSVSGTSAILDGAFISTASTGYYNNFTTRPNYRLSVKVYAVNDSNAYELIGTATYYPDATGLIRSDVSAFVRSKAKLLNTCQYTEVNEAEPSMGGVYNIETKENWTGSTEDWSTASPTTKHYWVNAARQLRDKYGSNLGEFVPYIDNDAVKARFLQLSGRPMYFPGFPFCLDFIYSNEITGLYITREVEFLDVNGTVISTSSTEIDASISRTLKVNHLMLPDLPPGCVKINAWLKGDQSQVAPGDNYVMPSFVATAFVSTHSNAIEPTPPIE